MSNNRVEVHVGAKTSELKKGMDDAEKIVSDSAKQIENTTKGVRFKFDLSSLGIEVDNLSITIETTESTMFGEVPVAQAFHNGILDG
ncbi:hypothetical protein, partial [Acinetobacter baumannii]|uniref:hypothetical protein n=1 Tax=Acinetobacter baumannii TaxID=470 RepID=UPI003891E930